MLCISCCNLDHASAMKSGRRSTRLTMVTLTEKEEEEEEEEAEEEEEEEGVSEEVGCVS